MITLGCYDADVSDATCAAYLQEVKQLTQLAVTEVASGADKLVPQRQAAAPGTMTVRQVQQALKKCGFFPGGRDDGIFGYRTRSALRLFQEYLRTQEKVQWGPDGVFGPLSQSHLQRWLDQGLQPSAWAPTIADWQAGTPRPGEYADWLQLLGLVKQKYLADPGPLLARVNAYTGATDTRKVAQWDFAAAGNTHLIGVRRKEFNGQFDDMIVLLIKGLVFKFQGSTEPGASTNPGGPPYLVPGQHEYRFGWHHAKQLALRPRTVGVLVNRAGADKVLDEADLAKPFDKLTDINVHWGGRGLDGRVNDWSEGCQVITGTLYIDAADQMTSCASYAAQSGAELESNPAKTRGAYNVLLDLIVALASDLPGNTLKYTLLTEEDLALEPRMEQVMASARQRTLAAIG